MKGKGGCLKMKKNGLISISMILVMVMVMTSMPMSIYASQKLDIDYLSKEKSKKIDEILLKIKDDKSDSEGYNVFMNLGILPIVDDGEVKACYIKDENGIIQKLNDKEYKGIFCAAENIYAVSLDDKWGYVDKSGKELLPCKYDFVTPFINERALVKKGDKFTFVDEKGDKLFKFSEFEKFIGNIIGFKLEDLLDLQYGDPNSYMDYFGIRGISVDELDDFVFEYSMVPSVINLGLEFLRGDRLISVTNNGRTSYMDKDFEKVMSLKYEYGGLFFDDMAVVSQGEYTNKYGYIDKNGKEVVPCKYTEAANFNDGMGLVSKNDQYGYVDKTGKEVIPCKYSGATDFFEGRATVQKGDRWGYIDKKGNEIAPFKYDHAWEFSEGLALVFKDEKYGYIDKTGKEVVPCKYDDAWPLVEGRALVVKDGKFGYIDKTGKEVIEPEYEDASYFCEGRASVYDGELWGVIDKKGMEIVPCKYDYVSDFYDGIATISSENMVGFVDKKGKKIIPCSYAGGVIFKNGIALAYDEDEDELTNAKITIMDLNTGEKLISKKAEYLTTHTLIRYRGQWGFVKNTYLIKSEVQDLLKKTIQMDKLLKFALPACAALVVIVLAIVAFLVSRRKKVKMEACRTSDL